MTTWILLRGLIRESRHWGPFVAQFERASPGSRVIALDLPGNGLRNQHVSPLNVRDMVEDCRAQLAHAGVAPPFQLLAMSLGGMVAVDWSAAYPDEVTTQVLINTSMRPFSPFYQRLKPQNYLTLSRLAFGGASDEQWERTIWRLRSNHATQGVVPDWIALRQSHPVARRNALRQLLAAARFRAPMARPAAPTLALASAQDHLVSPACSQALADHWRCELRLHPSAGHDLALDDGAWLVDQVKDWQALRKP